MGATDALGYFAADKLSIGEYHFETDMDDGKFIAAFVSYGKRRLGWDIMDGPLRRKIMIQWADIIGLKSNQSDGILKVKVEDNPSFWIYVPKPFSEYPTDWLPIADFTDGQALKLRTHILEFAPHDDAKLVCDMLLDRDPKLAQLDKETFLDSPKLPHSSSGGESEEVEVAVTMVDTTASEKKEFESSYKGANPDCQNESTVYQEGTKRWESMTDQEKSPYVVHAARLQDQQQGKDEE